MTIRSFPMTANATAATVLSPPATRPSIDLLAPARVETATFALG